jgi:hypothetical protein
MAQMVEDQGGSFRHHDSDEKETSSKRAAFSFSRFLSEFKSRYIEGCKTTGATAKGFRTFIGKQYTSDRTKFDALVVDALMEAATRCWERQPRRRGPDLFSISGETLPEFFTRSRQNVGGADLFDDEDGFEKVHQKFATVNDALEDATIGLRNAARASAAAEEKMRVVDEARKRAKGKMSAFLRDIADDT